KKYKVVTQMGNQGGSGDGVRKMKEMVDAGLIGDVHTVKCWTNRPVWPQGIPTPTGNYDVPKELDWNLWLGPAQYIPYNPAYLPFHRSEEHTSELQSRENLVCRLLLEKKNTLKLKLAEI